MGFTEVARAVYSAQEVLGRKINPKVYSRKEWNQMLKHKDALRKQRNVADYSGDTVPESAARDCLMHAENLLQNVRRWLKANRPELVVDL